MILIYQNVVKIPTRVLRSGCQPGVYEVVHTVSSFWFIDLLKTLFSSAQKNPSNTPMLTVADLLSQNTRRSR